MRYPRDGHGIRESTPVVDWIDRRVGRYDAHVPKRPRGR